MATKTFSSRADERRLAYADAITRKKYGMSFGQYCGSILLDAIYNGAELPDAQSAGTLDRKASAIATMKSLSARPHDEGIGRMSDAEVKQLIASRYE